MSDDVAILFLEMGVMGAALSTSISQTISLLVILTHYVFKKRNLLPLVFGAESIWFSMPITELLVATYASIMIIRSMKILDNLCNQ